MSAVRLEGVAKLYGDMRAVSDVDLVVDSGEFVTLLGPSGCGKTTTLRMIAGFVRPSAGRVAIADRDVTELPPHRREVGLVFQNYALFPHMSVADNVAFGLKMRKVPAVERAGRVREALALVRLEGFEARLPRQLSGGQQQRVALARALVIRPAVLLLDEPFGALDRQLRDHMRVELRALQRQLRISTVFVTHDQDEALSMSDRIVVMNGGRIEQAGTPTEIYEHPRTSFVASFMGRSNLLAGRIASSGPEGTIVGVGPLRLVGPPSDLAPGREVTVIVRPERIRLVPAEPGVELGGHRGRVTSIAYLGASYEVQLELADGQLVQVAVPNTQGAARSPLAVGAIAEIVVPLEAVNLGTAR